MTNILTPQEVAELLRLQPDQVDDLLEQGELPCFEVCGERRIVLEEVERFVARQMATANMKALGNRAVQMKAMAGVLAEDEPLMEELAGLDATPGTFGELLQMAAAMGSVVSKGSQGNVVAFASRRSQKGD
jgi:excisionase family DNA binding protein